MRERNDQISKMIYLLLGGEQKLRSDISLYAKVVVAVTCMQIMGLFTILGPRGIVPDYPMM